MLLTKIICNFQCSWNAEIIADGSFRYLKPKISWYFTVFDYLSLGAFCWKCHCSSVILVCLIFDSDKKRILLKLHVSWCWRVCVLIHERHGCWFYPSWFSYDKYFKNSKIIFIWERCLTFESHQSLSCDNRRLNGTFDEYFVEEYCTSSWFIIF